MDQRQPATYPRATAFEYRYMTEFQSHEPEFDYLKSLEIEEKINKVQWCTQSNNTRMLLSTNDKTIKLWKVRGEEALWAGPCV
jgi:serine/threonine-protein phosphatase 2A regulatory subunit B